MAFHENWFGAPKQVRLTRALSQVPRAGGAVVEVGCWEGRSTILIANTVFPSMVHCIDHWQGDLTDPKSPVARLAAERNVYADFIENMNALTPGNYVVYRAGWREVFAAWEQPIRFCFIDGQHTYHEVKDNIEALRPLLVPGAVLAGDDYGMGPVARAVRDTLGVVDAVPGAGHAIWIWRNGG